METFVLQQAAQVPPAAPSQPPLPPPIPNVPALPAPAIASGAPVGFNVPGLEAVIPFTADQIEALSERASTLSGQLRQVADRRKDLVRELDRTSSTAASEGIEQRIKFLDERMMKIEQDISANSELRASLAAKLGEVSSSQPDEPPVPPVDSAFGPITPPVAFFLLLPLALAGSRFMWKRGNRPAVVPISPQAEARFGQLEQAIDSVAVEIERVAEGQRFVTKLLREGQPIPDFTAGRASDAVGVRATPEASR